MGFNPNVTKICFQTNYFGVPIVNPHLEPNEEPIMTQYGIHNKTMMGSITDLVLISFGKEFNQSESEPFRTNRKKVLDPD